VIFSYFVIMISASVLEVLLQHCSELNLFSTGHGATKSDCTNDAYDIAWDIITTSSPEDIMQNCRRIEARETTGISVLNKSYLYPISFCDRFSSGVRPASVNFYFK
jgi:hypothetical protein